MSDRLLRVRATQPFSSTASISYNMKAPQHHEETLIVDDKIQIGELCVFKSGVGLSWNIGKV